MAFDAGGAAFGAEGAASSSVDFDSLGVEERRCLGSGSPLSFEAMSARSCGDNTESTVSNVPASLSGLRSVSIMKLLANLSPRPPPLICSIRCEVSMFFPCTIR